MSLFLRKTVDHVDKFIAEHYLQFAKEKNSLMTFLIHGLFKDNKEIELNHVRPQQRITLDIFRQFIEYFLDNGFIFISPTDILKGLSEDKKHILLTFDDGYFNNALSLPYLHEYNIPSVFFISSANVENNHSFWWDIVYREQIKREVPIKAIQNEISLLKKRKHNGIMQYIINNFGRKALNPISDIDRPFTPQELKSFSQDQNVFIGNHTANHAILTNYSESEIRSEIALAQTSLYTITGSLPEVISYPNGNFSDDVLTISKMEGLRLGITTFPRKNYLPINLEGITPFLINRFTLSGNVDIKKQCDSFRSDFTLRDFSRKFLKHNEPENY